MLPKMPKYLRQIGYMYVSSSIIYLSVNVTVSFPLLLDCISMSIRGEYCGMHNNKPTIVVP
jgi:hypothetical protein